MPELPEVEVVRRGLEKLLSERPVVEDVVFHRRDIRDPMPTKRIRRMIGHPITSVERRGKYLLFRTPAGFLLSHLGMTGSWRAGDGPKVGLHDHFEIHFHGGLKIIYRDPRRFGVIDWGDSSVDHPRLRALGPEPLSEAFNAAALGAAIGSRSAPIKTVLMDPSVVVGVGNIYASEALFRAGLRPTRPARKLRENEIETLAQKVREVLAEAIAAGGSSISDYVQANGESGSFQTRFRVYDRAGSDCPTCAAKIKRVVQSGRSTFFCPRCQR